MLLFFVMGTLLPLYTMLALTLRANSDILRRQQLQNLTSSATGLSAQTTNQINEWSKDSRHLAAEPGVVRKATGDPAGTDADALDALRRAQQSDPSFRVAFLADRTGVVTVSTDPALGSKQDFAGAQFYRQAVGGNPAVSDLYIGRAAPVPAVYVASPIRDALGNVVAVAVLQVSPDKIVSFFDPALLGQQRYAMLLDQHGIFIGTSGQDKTLYHSLAPLNPTDQQALKQAGNYGPGGVPDLGMIDLADQVTVPGISGSTAAYFSPDGQREVFGFAPLKGVRVGWRVLVAQPESAFLAPIDEATRNTAVFTTLAAGAILVVFIFVARAFERTERQSLTDTLTGLPNRRYFADILTREMQRSQRNHRPVSLINTDLDHFKKINDEYGHQKGDEILKGFARVLRDQVRSIDLPVRFGGEEFVVLLPDTDKEGAMLVAEKIRRSADRLSIPRLGNIPGRKVTVSLGVATYPNDSASEEDLMRCADQAMYLAKNLGRNQAVGYGEESGVSSLAKNPEKVHMLVQNANKATIEALAAAIDARDTYTHGHSHRVADYARIIASELEDEPVDAESLHLGALLHDVGKIGISDTLLRKPGNLTPEEFEIIKTHATIGYEMVRGVAFLEEVAPIIRHHHENFGGGGYPEGISGKAIPLASRIIMVCDAFDAMTSTRTYRDAGSVEGALEELTRHERRQFDPDIVDALKSAVRKGKLKLVSEPPPTAAQLVAMGAAKTATRPKI
ncbi:MAG TPA: diguanylate cyclase [Candidatus Dormibacteraeota bacterium]|nr:diguanylate cyclase [Candidatus Dormibacteraeota bacterium]